MGNCTDWAKVAENIGMAVIIVGFMVFVYKMRFGRE